MVYFSSRAKPPLGPPTEPRSRHLATPHGLVDGTPARPASYTQHYRESRSLKYSPPHSNCSVCAVYGSISRQFPQCHARSRYSVSRPSSFSVRFPRIYAISRTFLTFSAIDDGSRILTKYYSNPHPPAGNPSEYPGQIAYKTVKDQKAFEKGLLGPSLASEVLLGMG